MLHYLLQLCVSHIFLPFIICNGTEFIDGDLDAFPRFLASVGFQKGLHSKIERLEFH